MPKSSLHQLSRGRGVDAECPPSGARAIAAARTSVTAFIGRALSGPVNEPVPVFSLREFEREFCGAPPAAREADLLAGTLRDTVRDFFLNGGERAVIVRLAEHEKPAYGAALGRQAVIGSGLDAAGTALYALDRAESFNLLCLPEVDATSPVIARAADYCKERRAVLLVDPPSHWTTTQKAEYGVRSVVRHENAALFFPRLRRRCGSTRALFNSPPSGAVAGLIARTDARQGVWKAPAGREATLRGVPGLSAHITDDEHGILNLLGINCLRILPKAKPVVWGARTLGDDPDWKYIPVRRLGLFIEESLYRGTRWVLVEPDDEPPWTDVRSRVTDFMDGLFRRGALQGSAPDEAYYVQCDSETTTRADRDRGIVNIDVGFAPLKAAEFVVIRVQHRAG